MHLLSFDVGFNLHKYINSQFWSLYSSGLYTNAAAAAAAAATVAAATAAIAAKVRYGARRRKGVAARGLVRQILCIKHNLLSYEII